MDYVAYAKRRSCYTPSFVPRRTKLIFRFCDSQTTARKQAVIMVAVEMIVIGCTLFGLAVFASGVQIYALYQGYKHPEKASTLYPAGRFAGYWVYR